MENQISSNKKNKKKRNIVIYSILGGLTVIGLVVFGEETPHYASYSNVQQTYEYYSDGWSALVSDAEENDNQSLLEINEQSFRTFISQYQSGGYQNYQTVVGSYIAELDETAQNYFNSTSTSENDSATELADFQSSYITPAQSKLETISKKYVPRIYGFIIGVIVFILSLGVMLSFYFTRNSISKTKKSKQKSNKI